MSERTPEIAFEAAPVQQRILVRAPNWAGDLVMATPGFRALREAFPDASITLHAPAALLPMMRGTPWFDDLLAIEEPRRGLRGLRRAVASLRAAGPFDLGICLPDSISSALWMRLAGVAEVAGYSGRGRSWLLHRRVSAPEEWGPRRMVARERFVLTLVRALCPDAQDGVSLHSSASSTLSLSLPVAVDDVVWAEKTLRDIGLGDSAKGGLVGIAPGASYGPSKLWPSEAFAGLADRLINGGDRVVFLGSPSEREQIERIRSQMKRSAPSLAGRGDLGHAKALVARLSLLYCNDAGARHLASALGIPAVVFMGPTSLEKTDCNLERTRVLTADVDCRPCYERKCPIDHRCMTRISVPMALDAGERLRREWAGCAA